jgi:hypothetical protein
MSKSFVQRLRDALSNLVLDHEDARLGPELDEDGLARPHSGWKPKQSRKRIEIMITGDPSRVGAVADIMDDVQNKLFTAEKRENLELRVTGFLDGCIHRSKWFRKPFKAAAQARHWHCEQSKTRFADAFAESRGEMVDALVIVASRFDEDVEEALRQAEPLKQQGVPIHCFYTGSDPATKAAYEKIAGETEGVFMQLADQSAIAEIMPLIMAHIDDDHALVALQPQSETAQKLKNLLMAEPSPQPLYLDSDDEDDA